MKIKPEDLTFESWPENKNFGPHKIQTGIKATHKPTGYTVCVNIYRQQHKNKKAAIDFIKAHLE